LEEGKPTTMEMRVTRVDDTKTGASHYAYMQYAHVPQHAYIQNPKQKKNQKTEN
jgi:hypothetical protein